MSQPVIAFTVVLNVTEPLFSLLKLKWNKDIMDKALNPTCYIKATADSLAIHCSS